MRTLTHAGIGGETGESGRKMAKRMDNYNEQAVLILE